MQHLHNRYLNDGDTLIVSRSGNGVTRDATSGIYVPANATEWTSFRSTFSLTNWSNPTNLYGFQESASPIADAIGAINLTATATIGFRTAMTGWTRKMALIHDGIAETATGTFANANANSLLVVMIADVQSVGAAVRNVCTYGNASLAGAQATNTPRLRSGGTPGTFGTGTQNPIGRRAIVTRLNRATGGRDVLTDQEKIIGTTGTVQSGTSIIIGGFGSGSTLPPTFGVAYAAIWVGATAERSDADVKSLLQAMGYTISWS